jgi:hypothetical protein
MNKTLRDKILAIFDVYYSDADSNKAIVADLNRRGKFDNKKIMEILFLLMEEIESLKKPVIKPVIKPSVKKKSK